MAVEIVFETHSTSTDNEAGLATGWLPGRLSETGVRQAEALGRRRRDDGVTAVFTSDLHRAVQTAEIAFGGAEVPVHVDARLRECDYGDLNGMPVERIDELRAACVDEPFPGGESYRQAAERMASFLADLARDHDGARVVVIGHTATRWALDHLLHGTRLEELVVAPFAWQEGWEYRLAS
jgi:broad specificity phosphatase PhoE